MSQQSFKQEAAELTAEHRPVMEAIKKTGSPLEKGLVETFFEYAEVQE